MARLNLITGQKKDKTPEFPKQNQTIITGGGFNPNRYYNKSEVDTLLAGFTPAGSSDSGYRLADGPEYAASYVYVGYEHESNGGWYIYRREFSTNERLYAEGSSDYATNWTNRASLSYS